VLFLVLFLARGVGAAPIRISYSAISGAMSSLWVAQEGGYFKREGLDTELLYIGGGSLLIQSMLSGDVPFAYGPSVPVINASLRGADLVLIGNTGNSLVFSIMSRPEIKQPANLKGKRVGVTRLGGSTDWALDAALKHWGLERRDLMVVQTGGMPEGLAGLIGRSTRWCRRRAISRAVKAGMHELVMSVSEDCFSQYAAQRRFLHSNRTGCHWRFLRGFTQGLNRLRTDKESQHESSVQSTPRSDSETLAQLHQTFGVRYSGDRIPYVRAEGIDEILKRTPGKEAREAKAGSFFDNSVLTELEQSGWFKNLGR
jgi:hypothetical protein